MALSAACEGEEDDQTAYLIILGCAMSNLAQRVLIIDCKTKIWLVGNGLFRVDREQCPSNRMTATKT